MSEEQREAEKRVGSTVRAWSQAMYGTVHALRLMRAVDLGNLKKIGYSVQESLTWIRSDIGFESVVPDRELNPENISLDGVDEDEVFEKLARAVARMLLVSLASLLDECLAEALSARGHNPDGHIGGKLEQVRAHLPPQILSDSEWALAGARELITLRNVLVHAGGFWDERCVGALRGDGKKPAINDALSVGFADVLRYKRAVRTLLGEAWKIQHGQVA